MQRIIFYSENKTQFTGLSMKDLAEGILASCARHDPNGRLSGALLFDERYFVQVMEGDRKALAAKIWALAEDKRHSTMVILGAADIERRAFSTWSVGYAGRSEALDRVYLRFGSARKLDPTAMTAQGVLNLMNEFVHGDHGQFVKHADEIAAARAA